MNQFLKSTPFSTRFINQRNYLFSMPVSDRFLSCCIPCKAWCCTEVLPPITKEERDAIINEGFTDCFQKKEENLYCIQPNASGKCPFLKKDLSCKIHTVKPLLCKLWPVIPRYKEGKRECIVIHCPLFSQLSQQDLEKTKEHAECISPHIVHYLWMLSEEKKQQYKRFHHETI